MGGFCPAGIISALEAGSIVDIYRTPTHKDMPGWRGPGVLLDIDRDLGTGSVKWQGKVFLIPLRMKRPHVGLLAALCKCERLGGHSWPGPSTLCLYSDKNEPLTLPTNLLSDTPKTCIQQHDHL